MLSFLWNHGTWSRHPRRAKWTARIGAQRKQPNVQACRNMWVNRLFSRSDSLFCYVSLWGIWTFYSSYRSYWVLSRFIKLYPSCIKDMTLHYVCCAVGCLLCPRIYFKSVSGSTWFQMNRPIPSQSFNKYGHAQTLLEKTALSSVPKGGPSKGITRAPQHFRWLGGGLTVRPESAQSGGRRDRGTK